MEYKDLLYEKKGHVASTTFNRPERLNALSRDMLETIAAVCEEINKDDDVRVAVFTGAGRAFCAGLDLKESSLASGEMRWLEVKPQYTDVSKILDCDKPTIGAINGVAVGGGFVMALECDIRIASDRASMSPINAKVGMPVVDPVGDLLPRAVGLSKALEWLYTADIIDAEECERIGLVSRVVPHDRLMDDVYALANKIAMRPPVAVRLTKNVVMAPVRQSYVDSMPLHAFAAAMNRKVAKHDIEEGTRAFHEKRDPVFKGLLKGDGAPRQ